MIKNIWRHWVSSLGKYHEFKSFKVYWAFRWEESEKIDKQGFIPGGINPKDFKEGDSLRYTNYSKKYINH